MMATAKYMTTGSVTMKTGFRSNSVRRGARGREVLSSCGEGVATPSGLWGRGKHGTARETQHELEAIESVQHIT